MKPQAIIYIIITVFTVRCKSLDSATVVDQHPFNIVEATYNHWVGGQPGVRGIHIKIIIDNPSIQLDSILFRNQTLALQREKDAEQALFVGNYTRPYIQKEMILSSDRLEEYGNTIPPVNINRGGSKDEKVILSYQHNNKVRLFKIEKLKQTDTEYRY
jgi:hypothetical protein